MLPSFAAWRWYETSALVAVIGLVTLALVAALFTAPQFVWWLGAQHGVYQLIGTLAVLAAAMLLAAATWHTFRRGGREPHQSSAVVLLLGAIVLVIVFGELVGWGQALMPSRAAGSTAERSAWGLQSWDAIAGILNVLLGTIVLGYLGLAPWLVRFSPRLETAAARRGLPLLRRPLAVIAVLSSVVFLFVSVRLFWLGGSLDISRLASLSAWRTFTGTSLAVLFLVPAVEAYLKSTAGAATLRLHWPLAMSGGVVVCVIGIVLGLGVAGPPPGGGDQRDQIVAVVARLAEPPPSENGPRAPVLTRVGRFQNELFAAMSKWQGLSPVEQLLEQADALARRGRYAEAEDVLVAVFDRSSSPSGSDEMSQDVEDRLEAALAQLHREMGTSGSGHVRAAESLLAEGKRNAALAHLELAVDAEPNNLVARLKLGRLLTDLRRLKEAHQHALAAAEIEPDSAAVHILLGEIWLRDGDLQRASDGADAALRIDPDSVGARMLRGVVRIRINDFRGAVEDFGRVLELEPENQRALMQRGIANLMMGFDDRANADFARCRELYPESASDIAVQIGTVRWAQGRPSQAVRRFEEAVRLDPQNQTARQWLQRVEGVLFEGSGNNGERSG